MERTEDGRLRSADVFKGLAISFIAVLHLAIAARARMDAPAPAVQALYLGLMGFFIMSGYFLAPGRGFGGSMRRRCRSLLLVLIVAATVLPLASFAWCCLWGQPTDAEDLLRCLIRTFAMELSFMPYDDTVPWAVCGFSMGYYFLWCMLFAFLVFYAVADRVRDDTRLGTLAVVALVALTATYREALDFTLPMYVNLSPIAAAFMICGMYMRERGLGGWVESGRVRSLGWWSLFLGSAGILLAMVHVLPPGIFFDRMSFGEYGGYSAFPYMVEGVLAFVTILYLSFFISKIPVLSKALEKLGRHTLGILLLHVFIAKMALAPFFAFDESSCLPTDFTGVARVLFSLSALLVSYLVCEHGPAVLDRLMKRGGKAKGSEDGPERCGIRLRARRMPPSDTSEQPCDDLWSAVHVLQGRNLFGKDPSEGHVLLVEDRLHIPDLEQERIDLPQYAPFPGVYGGKTAVRLSDRDPRLLHDLPAGGICGILPLLHPSGDQRPPSGEGMAPLWALQHQYPLAVEQHRGNGFAHRDALYLYCAGLRVHDGRVAVPEYPYRGYRVYHRYGRDHRPGGDYGLRGLVHDRGWLLPMDREVVHDERSDGAALPSGEHEDLPCDVAAVPDAHLPRGPVDASEEAQRLRDHQDLAPGLPGRYHASFEPHMTTPRRAEMSRHMAFCEHSVGR